jgi:hypothetical protein
MTQAATPYARTTDPETSHEAAARLHNASAYTEKIVRFLYENDRPEGWTEHEITAKLNDDLGECPWRRITDARSRGHAEWAVTEDGKPVKRPGNSTRSQGASRISDLGRQYGAEQGFIAS